MFQSLIVISSITGPFFMLGASPIVYLYYLIQKKYRAAALQYKRMESVTRSPIYNHASESLSGVSTIRAYDTRDQAEAKNALVTNTNTSATFCMRTIERWLGIRLESIGNAIVLVAGLMGVASKGTGIYTGYVSAAPFASSFEAQRSYCTDRHRADLRDAHHWHVELGRAVDDRAVDHDELGRANPPLRQR